MIRKYILIVLLFFLLLLLLSGCEVASLNSIIGTWQITSAGMYAINSDFYIFNNDNTYSKASDKEGLQGSPIYNYLLDSSGRLTLISGSYDAFINKNIMHWYQSGIEKYTLTKQ